MYQEISLSLLECKKLLVIINEMDQEIAKEFQQKLDKRLEEYNKKVKEYNERHENDFKVVLEFETLDMINTNFLFFLDSLLEEYQFFILLHEIEDSFRNINILEEDYQELLKIYHIISDKIERISSKLELQKLTDFNEKRYHLLYQILYKAIRERENLPQLNDADLKQICFLLKNDLMKINKDFKADITFENIEEYLKYVLEYKKNDKKSENKKTRGGFFSTFLKSKNTSIEGSEKKSIGPKVSQEEIGNSILGKDYSYRDLHKIDFTGVNIEGANLEGTRAKINPQLVYNKSLVRANLKGLNLSKADFTGVEIRRTNLEGTRAKINPQLVCYKFLGETNLKGLDLSEADFTNVYIVDTNLEDTGARVIVNGEEVVFPREEAMLPKKR